MSNTTSYHECSRKEDSVPHDWLVAAMMQKSYVQHVGPKIRSETAQKAGYDYAIQFRNGVTKHVDVKFRFEDDYSPNFLEHLNQVDDVLLEYGHSDGRIGWAKKDMLCDYVFYTWVPSGISMWLPVPQLPFAIQRNFDNWMEFAEDKQNKCFSLVDSKPQKGRDGTYKSHNISVPRQDLIAAINQQQFTQGELGVALDTEAVMAAAQRREERLCNLTNGEIIV